MRKAHAGKAIPRPFRRRIHLEGEVWTYQVTSRLVLVREPDPSLLHEVLLSEVVGMSPSDIERGIWKKTWAGVGPGEVRAYITRHLRGQRAS
jgi:hypothetical protein